MAADILSSHDADNTSHLVDYIISMWSSTPPSAKNFLFLPDWGLSRSSFCQAVHHFLLLSDKTAIHDQAYAGWLQQFQLTQTALEVIPATPSAPSKPSTFSTASPLEPIPYNNLSFILYQEPVSNTDSTDRDSQATPPALESPALSP